MDTRQSRMVASAAATRSYVEGELNETVSFGVGGRSGSTTRHCEAKGDSLKDSTALLEWINAFTKGLQADLFRSSFDRLFAKRLNRNSLANDLPQSDLELLEHNNLTALRLVLNKELFLPFDLSQLSPFLIRFQSPTLLSFALRSEPTAYS